MKKSGKIALRQEVKARLALHGFQLSERNLRLFVDTVLETAADQLFESGSLTLQELGTLDVERNNRQPQFGTRRPYRIRYKSTATVRARLEAMEG